MKILFCGQAAMVKELGASKVLIELAEELTLIGWECKLLAPADLTQLGQGQTLRQAYPEALRDYLVKHAEEFDVIDYDHEYLPFPRSVFSARPLFVARSVLLTLHLASIPIPTGNTLRSRIGQLVRGRSRSGEISRRVCQTRTTVEQADLVNVSNWDDRDELVRRGIPEDKIVVIPYGISRRRRPLFDAVSSEVRIQPRVAFVGTFDYRKGAREFPSIVRDIVEQVPDVRFRLLGTSGMFATAEQVLAHFPSALAPRIEVIPRYKADELPSLLAECSLGIFPTYMEGMPFGVLEMLASSLPVFAYDSPGPSMMLPRDYLVPRGDSHALAARTATLLNDTPRLAAARISAKERSQEFTWEASARQTDDLYRKLVATRNVK
ncbi:MAG: glycosyltransferase family 4 protein [Capsulimonadaceae bacterium]